MQSGREPLDVEDFSVFGLHHSACRSPPKAAIRESQLLSESHPSPSPAGPTYRTNYPPKFHESIQRFDTRLISRQNRRLFFEFEQVPSFRSSPLGAKEFSHIFNKGIRIIQRGEVSSGFMFYGMLDHVNNLANTVSSLTFVKFQLAKFLEVGFGRSVYFKRLPWHQVSGMSRIFPH